MKRIVRYIAGTTEYGCTYRSYAISELKLLGFSNSDHAGDLEKRRSTSGVVFFLNGNVITWCSQKQRVVYLSSCEAEYIAVWLCRLIADLAGRNVEKFRLLMDNKVAIELSKNPVFHERSKHIDTRYHYIRECVANGIAEVEHVGTNKQLADILKKPLGRVKFIEMRQKLGVSEICHN